MEFETFDEAYTARLRSGDRGTEAHFVDYFGRLIDLKLRSRIRSREAAEDLKQETFVRVLKLVRSQPPPVQSGGCPEPPAYASAPGSGAVRTG